MANDFDPEWVALEAAMGPVQPLPEDIRENAAQFARFTAFVSSQWPEVPGLEVINTSIDGRINVRIYKPTEASTRSLPGGVFFHSGGTFAGDLDTEDAHCKVYASQTPCVVVSIDYRKTIEHPLSVATDDATEGFEWVRLTDQAFRPG